MDYIKLPLNIRNKNIQNISVVLNTLDSVLFPNINKICKVDYDRFELINIIQRELGVGSLDKDSIYNFCVSFEQNL